MAEISVICFKRELFNQIPISTRFEHWGIFVKYKDEQSSKFVYHADKKNIVDISTKFEARSWDRMNHNKVDLIILVGYSSGKFTHEEMINSCKKITEGRVFNTLTNNCQEWVKVVLSELVKTGNLSNLALEELKDNNEITPLLGW
jgi:uncharacterized protein YaeQ